MRLLKPFRQALAYVFRTRSIIIISDRTTNHVRLSSALQLGALVGLVTCVAWASYSTGRYMSTSSELEDKDETLRSVVNARIDTSTSFSYAPANLKPQLMGPAVPSVTAKLADPAYALSAVSQEKLFARIALLENRLKELRSTNADIMRTVREKAHGKILNMEDIIRQTGLDPDALKAQAARSRTRSPLRSTEPQQEQEEAPQPSAANTEEEGTSGGQGGPFIPADMTNTVNKFRKDLQVSMDEVALLSDILRVMPLGQPMHGGSPQSSFGRRVDPFTGRLAFHSGMDTSGPAGAEVHATGDGRITHAGWNGAYGNAIDIDHGMGLGIATRYAHLSRVLVEEGAYVKKGQVIGIQGSTGRSTGPHLHYEVRLQGRPVNPISFVSARYVP